MRSMITYVQQLQPNGTLPGASMSMNTAGHGRFSVKTASKICHIKSITLEKVCDIMNASTWLLCVVQTRTYLFYYEGKSILEHTFELALLI